VARVAAVDLGTNSTRLLVADVVDGCVADVTRESRVTRLGEGVDERRRLLPVPVTRVRNTLTDYRRTAERLGAEHTLAVATSAVRDAENGEAFLGEVEWSYGFVTRLLSGHEEALLTYRGVTSARPAGSGMLIVDIGGGSTELIAAEPDGVRWHDSLDIGSVRLTERFLPGDPPTERELAACAAAVQSLLAECVPDEIRGRTTSAVGVAGTITTLAALADESPLTPDALSRQLDRLASLPLAERRLVPSLDPERAPVIVAGAVIARETLAFFGVDRLAVSGRDILDGAALAAAELPDVAEGAAPPGAYTCC
jgi:exopolyphosphatase / guanosine-5'-triphosphate,3'-diphosphate pyrophosphatase